MRETNTGPINEDNFSWKRPHSLPCNAWSPTGCRRCLWFQLPLIHYNGDVFGGLPRGWQNYWND